MSERAFLGGKVLCQSLPCVRPPIGPEVPNLKRLLLPQGELAQIYDAAEGIRYLAMIELKDGNTRGNHYHRTKEEFVYVLQGEVLLVVEDIETRAREQVPLQAGDLAFIQTHVAHALRIPRPGLALEFSKARFDAADIVKYPLDSPATEGGMG
jgi:mannose-6-phosphate isomerase-like protein (cupin superfamily)